MPCVSGYPQPLALHRRDSRARAAHARTVAADPPAAAGITIEQVVKINQDINIDVVAEGQTILLPAGKLSARDKEILDGMGVTYRLYPVRAGESLKDITAKRDITMEEMEQLNPGINLNRVKGGRHRTSIAPAPWQSPHPGCTTRGAAAEPSSRARHRR
jgi:hypothetical protein